MGKITSLRLTQAQQLFLFFRCPGALHLCTMLRMKVSPRPPWTSVSLCNPLTRLSPTASSLQAFLCLSAVLTPVASRLPSLSTSHQRPQTGWQQITFSSTQKKSYRHRVRGKEFCIHCRGLWGLLAGNSAGDTSRLSCSLETGFIGPVF